MQTSLFDIPSKYVIDSSSLIDLFRLYPPERKIFYPLWEKINKATTEKLIISSRYVKKELNLDNNEEILKWIKNSGLQFAGFTSEETRLIPELQRHFPNLINWNSDENAADPWIITLAITQKLTVITEEKKKPNAHKIPNVCEYFGIECINLLGLFGKEGW